MKFALIAFLALNGEIHAFKLDTGLTYEDCQAATVAGVRSAVIVPGLDVDLSRAPLVCEPELSPAITIAAFGEG